MAEGELWEADTDADEEEAENEDPTGEPGGGGVASLPPPPPPAAVNSSFSPLSDGRGLLRGDWAREVGKKGKMGEAFAGLKLPKEPPVQSPLPEAPADAAAKIKGESATREDDDSMLSEAAIAAAAVEAIKVVEDEGGEDA